MSLTGSRCVVVKAPSCETTEAPPYDLLPWADPYIARLLCKHRLQAALEDSVRYVKSVAADRANLSPVRIDQAYKPAAPALRPQSVNCWND